MRHLAAGHNLAKRLCLDPMTVTNRNDVVVAILNVSNPGPSIADSDNLVMRISPFARAHDVADAKPVHELW